MVEHKYRYSLVITCRLSIIGSLQRIYFFQCSRALLHSLNERANNFNFLFFLINNIPATLNTFFKYSRICINIFKFLKDIRCAKTSFLKQGEYKNKFGNSKQNLMFTFTVIYGNGVQTHTET